MCVCTWPFFSWQALPLACWDSMADPGCAATTLEMLDLDGDGQPDYLDADDDGDGIDTGVELAAR